MLIKTADRTLVRPAQYDVEFHQLRMLMTNKQPLSS